MNLLPLIKPQTIAVIGASRDHKKIGAQIVANIIKAGFTGALYPINTKAQMVQGIKAYPSIKQITADIDLAIITIPKQLVYEVVQECIEKKVKSICIITAGFKEIDEEGAHLEDKIAELCKKATIPLLGPNCLGIINPSHKLNASFTAQEPLQGNVTFISQSGAFGTAAIDWANAQNIGFNLFVSLGNKALLNENHFLKIIQPETKIVALYLESITAGEQFVEHAAAISRNIPIVLLKPGKSKDAQTAAKSHTGALTGSDTVVTTACKQAGIIRVNTSQELFNLIKAFAYLQEMKGNNIAIITNAGGPSIMATDTLEECGLKLAPLSTKTLTTLSQYLPREANMHNPIDLIGDAKADRYDHALDAVLEEPTVNACIVLLTPQSATEIELTAQTIIKHAKKTKKPIMASFIGGTHIEKAVHILNNHKIPCFDFPEQAVQTLGKMWEYYKNKEKISITLPHITATFLPQNTYTKIVNNCASSKRTFLLQDEIEAILSAAEVNFPKKKKVVSGQNAWESTQEIGTPVVMKISSPHIIHKSEANAIALNLCEEIEIKDAYLRLENIIKKYRNEGYIYIQKQIPPGIEIIIGMKRDPIFGPVIIFGTGGIYTEIYKDTATRIAPISKNTAREMIQETKIATILNGYRRSQPYDIQKIIQIIINIANLSRAYQQIEEIDINPITIHNDTPIALDARIILAKTTR